MTHTRTGWTPELKNDATVPVGGITYTATYTEATAWIVTFDTDGGSNINPVTVIVPEGETNVVVKPEVDPTKAGYRFDGWYLGETKYDFNSEVTESITLTAKWLNDANCNGVEDEKEIVSIKVTGEGEIALSEGLIEMPISTEDTKSYIFDSTKPSITITATPVVNDGVSSTYDRTSRCDCCKQLQR